MKTTSHIKKEKKFDDSERRPAGSGDSAHTCCWPGLRVIWRPAGQLRHARFRRPAARCHPCRHLAADSRTTRQYGLERLHRPVARCLPSDHLVADSRTTWRLRASTASPARRQMPSAGHLPTVGRTTTRAYLFDFTGRSPDAALSQLIKQQQKKYGAGPFFLAVPTPREPARKFKAP